MARTTTATDQIQNASNTWCTHPKGEQERNDRTIANDEGHTFEAVAFAWQIIRKGLSSDGGVVDGRLANRC